MAAELNATGQLTERELFDRLERLERAVFVPNVSGEVAQWLDSVAAAAKEVAAMTCEYYRTIHPQLYEQILEQDPEQNTRVQALEQEDEEICDSLKEVVELAEKLQEVGGRGERDERRFAHVTKELSDRAIANVLRVRKQETQVSTWHAEAMLRDHGAVD